MLAAWLPWPAARVQLGVHCGAARAFVLRAVMNLTCIVQRVTSASADEEGGFGDLAGPAQVMPRPLLAVAGVAFLVFRLIHSLKLGAPYKYPNIYRSGG